jgi:anti-sigma factor RsiW
MSIADDKLEIWLGRLLDGELSPAEQRALEQELEQNNRARELFEQLRTLHECAREAVTHDVIGRGADPDEVFGRAWQQHKKSFWRRGAKADGHLRWGLQTRFFALGGPRFAVGLAAGFLLGLVLHFALTGGSKPSTDVQTRPTIARNLQVRTRPAPAPWPAEQVMRNVDWYSFTDDTGAQWLVQGIREGVARPAAYYGDF